MNKNMRWSMLLMLLLIGFSQSAFSQTEEWHGEGSGNFYLSQDIALTQAQLPIVVKNGDLTINVTPGTHPSIKRAEGEVYTSNGSIFRIEGSNKLTIKGLPGDSITIDGGMSFTPVPFYLPDGSYNPEFDAKGPMDNLNFPNYSSNTGIMNGNVIWVKSNGGLELDYVIIKNAATYDGVIYDECRNANRPFIITNTSIRYCCSGVKESGSAIFFAPGRHDNALLENVSIKYCINIKGAGTIRTTGSTETVLTMRNCEMGYNWVLKWGGAISWYAGGRPVSALTIEGTDTKIHHNVAGNNGGGIYGGANLEIKAGKIYGNRAIASEEGVFYGDGMYSQGCGGGVFLFPYTGPSNVYAGQGLICTINEDVSIYDNYAVERGGGLYIDLVASDWAGFYQMNEPIHDEGENYFTICDVNVENGCQIYGNSAAQGAGLCVMDFLPYRHRNTHSGNWSYPFRRVINFEGEIKDNHASYINATNDVFYGGGVYVNKTPRLNLVVESETHGVVGPEWDENLQFDYENSGGGAGTTTITINGGEISGNTAKSNGQGFGGGFCIRDEFPSNVESTCDVVIGGDVRVVKNECDNSGGGVYQKGGFFTMEGGFVGEAPDGNISNANVADVDGGGFYIEGGKCTVQGGTISYNEAKRNGGGFYVNVANADDVTIVKGGAQIIHNQALNNGGGAFVNKGIFKIEDASTGFVSNEAKQGGGIFLSSSSGEVLVNGAYFDNNNATGTGGNGGGIYSQGPVTITGNSRFYKNNADNQGGAIFINQAQFLMQGGVVGGSEVNANTAKNGAGFYVTGSNSEVNLEGGEISYNVATTNGGGFYVTGTSKTVGLTQSVKLNYNQAKEGGGAWLSAASLLIDGTNIEVKGNKAINTNGGGFYLNSGDIIIKGGGIIANNSAQQNGGAIYTNTTQAEVTIGEEGSNGNFTITGNHAERCGGAIRSGGDITIYTGTLSKNYAGWQGGAIFVNGGKFTLNGGTVGGTTTEGNYTTATDNSSDGGGGIYINGGEAFFNNGVISGNHVGAGTNGGGIFMKGGECTVAGGTLGGISNTYANSAELGGGIYSAGGIINVTQSSKAKTIGQISHNIATEGGGIYSNGNTARVNVDYGNIEYNEATNGGGIYVNLGEVDFSNGDISYNQASECGGGMYITENGTLALSGSATLSGNHVPAEGQGGGVFLAGVVTVGTENGDGTDAVIAEDNYAGDSYQFDPDNGLNTRNNVYLPSPRVNDGHKDVITIFANGMALQAPGSKDAATHVGFSVPRNYVPVIYCDNIDYLRDNKEALEATVFDDSKQYSTIWNGSAPYNANYIYLSGILWTEYVNSEPSGFTVVEDNVTITDEEGLAWLISYVNGRIDTNPPIEPHNLAGMTVTLEPEHDLIMSSYGWVPIGTGNAEFMGTFDGKGNTVSGLVAGFGDNQGMFGIVSDNALIKDLFIENASLTCTNSSTETFYVGGIANTLKDNAMVSGCGASATMYCQETATGVVMGGLVGKMEGNASISSCYATPAMEGYTMGGLVGEMASGSVLNSFAYPKFSPTSGSTAYIGGLASKMEGGIVENCYVREQTGSNHGNCKFGWFAGNYTAGAFNFCYAPENANYTHTGTLGNTGYGWFNPTALVGGKYGFKHQDQDVTVVAGDNNYVENHVMDAEGNLYGLLAALNNWVDSASETYAGTSFTPWTRTMGSSINGDYPVLKYESTVCVGSNDNNAIAYRTDLNDMITYANTGNGSAYLYQTNPTEVGTSTTGTTRVYIAPNVAIKQADGNTLNARVGVTLDNSSTGFMAYDWHMFSPALTAAPLGIEYHSNNSGYYIYNHYSELSASGIENSVYNNPDNMNPPMTTWSGENIGYFPTDTPYGAPYTDAGSFDFYCLDENTRQWINFKREGREGFYDHWNQYTYLPTDNHKNIRYENETELTPGKGYMVALSEPSMLMADGVLNNGTVKYTATYYEGVGNDYPLRGVNLVGNPFQSYLDFNVFSNTNGIGTYYILDADAKGYIAYTSGQTPQQDSWPSGLLGFSASQYIHPHQGFLVMVNEAKTLTFNKNMRQAEANSNFRDWTPNYALVNIACTDNEGRNDFATVELDRPEQGGGEKIKGLHAGNASVWFHFDDTDYQTAFTTPGLTTAPLRFKAYKDGVFTLSWGTANGDFSYLHLIDNKTGMDVDCLTTDSYAFEGSTEDYLSRFKLVFDYTGTEEDEDGASTGSATFAFQMGNELVVNGEGMLQMFDINGRCLMSTMLYGQQNTISLPTTAAGVYVLRLTSGSQVKTQKMVVR